MALIKNNTAYDVLKYIALIGVPAALTFYGIIGTTLNLPYTQETLTIGAAGGAFLGTLLGISSAQYTKENE